MEYQFRFDAARNALVCQVSGEVTLDEVKQSMRDRYEHPDYTPGVHLIVDMSGTSADALVDFDIAEYQRFAREIRDKHNDRNLSLMVAPADLTFGLSRMVQQTSEAVDGDEVQVFRSLDDAYAHIESQARTGN